MEIYKTDWLNSDPVFYHEKTGKVSKNINDVIEASDFDFDPEGLFNYLEFGFSVLGKTPIRNVRFLEHSSQLAVENGQIEIEKFPDPVSKLLGRKSTPTDAIGLMREKVNNWEKSFETIVVPTSGGYDSRLLNLLVEDKKRIRSYTYGISVTQSESSEVQYAKKISEILHTHWKQIELENFHQYFNDWYEMYGVSTHAHGMYHIDFYTKIMREVTQGSGLLSGIIGDAWSGRVNLGKVNSWVDVKKMSYSHGINISGDRSLLKSNHESLQKYFQENKEKLEDPSWRIIESMRFKIILLSYLFRVPKKLGMEPWSPFTDIDCATSMLNLPANEKENRKWQTEFFRENKLDVENMISKPTMSNNLDLTILARYPVKPLKKELLREIIDPKFVDWVNQKARSASTTPLMRKLLNNRYSRRVTGPLGMMNESLEAYNAHLVLWPLQKLIEDRNSKLNSK